MAKDRKWRKQEKEVESIIEYEQYSLGNFAYVLGKYVDFQWWYVNLAIAEHRIPYQY